VVELGRTGVKIGSVEELKVPDAVKKFSAALKIEERKLAEQLARAERQLEAKIREVSDKKTATQEGLRYSICLFVVFGVLVCLKNFPPTT